MALATRHIDDRTEALSTLPGLVVRREDDAATMAALQGRTEVEMSERFAAGHRAWVAWLHDEPAAWGWSATLAANIGELGSSFRLAPGQRYLWNFVTLKQYRGMGIYPRLLAAIMADEAAEAERFWIAWAPENHASGAGIRKAGFTAVAELSFDRTGRPAVASLVPGGGSLAARTLNLPESDDLALCWRCARAREMACAAGACSCDYQRPEIICV